MTRFTFNMLGRTLAVASAVVVGAVFSVGAAQDSSFIPIKVNVAATVKAVPKSTAEGAETVTLALTANKTDTLRLPYVMTTGVIYFGGQRHANAPTIVANSGGNVTVNLPSQSYKSAEVALYTVNGKRVMSRKVSSSNAVNNISRRNVATGVYMLSVKGATGEAVTARLTHSGGGLSINTAFTGGSVADARKLSKEAADLVAMTWTVTVSAEGYKDSVFTVQPVKWTNPLRTITLNIKLVESIKGTFTDERDGTVYKTVKINSQTWMAENLNISTRELSSVSWCYKDSPDSCAKYGRLYTWAAASTACPTGWHLPTRDEWGALSIAAGGTGTYGASGTAGKVLKSASGWGSSASYNGTDDFGFSALPGGYRNSGGSFYNVGNGGDWWAATELGSSYAYYRSMNYNNDRVDENNNHKSYASSVRCVQDE